MKFKILILVLLLCTAFSRLSSQNYSVTDSLALLAIDATCDVSDSLNWNTEPDPGNWVGVTWDAENPKRVVQLNISSKSLTDTMNVSSLINLTDLQCYSNQLTSLDVSTLTNLISLNCSINQLTTLDVSALTSLTSLSCNSNQLTDLDVSALVNLNGLYCSNNQLTDLDVSALVNLTGLYCLDNQLTNLDVSALINLDWIDCSDNQLTVLDVSGLTNLTLLYCYSNQLTDLNVSTLVNLAKLYCSINPLGELDVSALTNLTFLSCYVNDLTSLDVSALTNLTTLVFSTNQLTSIDISALTNLTVLNCTDNHLTSLDVSALVNLTGLYCSDNQLTDLDVSALSNLSYLECYHNRLPFSSLVTGLNVDNFSYIPQDTIFEPQSISGNTTIDYSAEALIDGTATQFVFYKDGTEAESNTTGLFTTTGPGEYYCTMTNAKFLDLTLTTAIVTVTENTGVEDVHATGFGLYPNPVEDKLNIRLSQNDLPSLTGIYTMGGKEMILIENKSSIFEIDMETFKPGIYILKIITPGSSIEEKIVKL
jgi:Leucine-rich repeat (LRR) protein